MKEKITAIIDNLLIYDYILFFAVFFLFILFIVLTILLRKRLFFSLLSLFIGFFILLVGPTSGYVELHKYLFKNSIELVSQKQLTFVKAIVVHGVLKNESKFNFKECKIKATVYKVSKNRWKNYIFALKPLKKSVFIIHNINKSKKREFKFFVEPFNYSKKYKLVLGAKCK